MASIWIDYPIGVFTAAARTTLGGILLVILACVIGGWLVMSSTVVLHCACSSIYYTYGECWGHICYATEEMMEMMPFIGAIGVLRGYGIPFVLVQVVCAAQLIWMEYNLLHSWFAITYCQAFLTYLARSSFDGWGDWEEIAGTVVALLVLVGLHIFLAWLIRRQKITIVYRREEKEEDADGSPMDN